MSCASDSFGGLEKRPEDYSEILKKDIEHEKMKRAKKLWFVSDPVYKSNPSVFSPTSDYNRLEA